MSQVRKLLQGNKIEKHAYGKVILGSDVYDMNDEDTRRAFESYLAQKGAEYGDYAGGVMELLRSGKDYVGDRISNTSNYGGQNERTANKLSKQRSEFQKTIDALTNNSVQQSKNAIHYINNFSYSPETKETSKNKVNNDKIFFVYDDNDGTPVYAANDPKNQTIEARFNNYLDYLADRDNWTSSNEWSNDLGENDEYLRTWWNSQNGENKRELANQQIQAALEEVKSKPWDEVSDSTKRFLSYFNIGQYDSSTSSNSNNSSSTDEKKSRKMLKDAGFNEDLYKFIGSNFEIGNDGSLRSKSGAFDIGWDGNIYFNDDFYNSQYGSDGAYDAFRGLTYYNGALYNKNSSKLAQILNTSGGFNDLIKNGDFDAADRIIQTRFTDAARENPKGLDSDAYSEFMVPGRLFSNLTGLYGLNNGVLNPGEQIVQYIDLNDTIADGPYLNHNYKYAVLNNRGQHVRDISFNDLQKIYGGQASALNTYKRTTDTEGAYSNKYYEDIKGKNGQASGIRIYRDINNPDEDVILHLDDSDWKLNAGRGHDIKLPAEVARILMEDQSWVDKVVGNSQARKQLGETLSSLIEGRGFRQLIEGWPFAGPNFGSKDLDYNLNRLRKIGFSRDTARRLQKALNAASRGNKHQRRDDYLLETPGYKNGGKVQYISKLAAGGVSGGSKESNPVSDRIVNKKVHDPRNASSLSEIGTDNWTDADTKDLMALVGDVGSLGLAFVPGANLASAATGAAGSFARFSADKSRGTKGAGWQLGLNLAMDAATLLPFLGGAAKAGKVAAGAKVSKELLQKAARVVITGASVWGLGSAIVNSANKIANNEKFTVRDVSNVVNGITAGVGIVKSGGFGKQTKKTTTKEFVEQNFKVGNEDVKLTSEQLNEISKASDQPLALRQVIKAQAKNASDKQVAEAAEKLLKPGKTNIWQKIRRKDGDIVLNLKKQPKSSESTVEATGDLLHDWWYRTGKYQQLYNSKLINEGAENTPKSVKKQFIESVEPGRSYTREYIKTDSKGKPKFTKGEFVKTGYASKYVAGPDNSGFTVIPEGVRYLDVKTGRANVRPYGNGIRFNRNGLINYYNRIAIARPDIILPLKLSGYSYETPEYKKGGIIKAENGLGYGGWGRDSGGLYKLVEPLLGGTEFITSLVGSKKVEDLGKKRAEASRVHVMPHQYTTYDYHNPALQQQRNYIQSLAQTGIKPQSSDVTNYYSAALMNQANINKELNQNTAQTSEYYSNIGKLNADKQEATLNSAIDTANQNSETDSAVEAAKITAEMQGEIERKNSTLNKIHEIRTKWDTTKKLLDQYQLDLFNQGQQQMYDNLLDSKIGSQYRKEWMGLGEEGQSNYTGFEDWLYQKYPTLWKEKNLGTWIDTNRSNMANMNKRKQFEILLGRPALSSIGTNHEANTSYYKKGGKVNGTTRYTLEPDEQIWVNNNKAAHAAIAKLNDDTIKLLLRALK